jgi:ferredoxin
LRVVTSPETCVGCGQCALSVPEVFDQDQELGTVVLLVPEPADDLHYRVGEAARNCPVGAISVSEE